MTMVILFSGTAADMRNWNAAARIFSYKEIKAATSNFKEVIGRGSFGSVYIGKLPEGKLVAVKVRFDRTQLGADSFVNEVFLMNYLTICICLHASYVPSKVTPEPVISSSSIDGIGLIAVSG